MTQSSNGPETFPVRPRHVLKVLAISILFLGLGLRCLKLGDRPLHHDESIHATFSAQWAEGPDRYYKYDPTYHGPFLYCITRFIFPLFGVGAAEARLFPLLFGVLSLFSTLAYFRWLGLAGTAMAFALMSLSPLLVYYSRFLAHDMPSLFFGSLMALSVLFFRQGLEGQNARTVRRAALLWSVASALLFSVKTVALLYVFIFVTFWGFDWALRRATKQPALLNPAWKRPGAWLPLATLCAFAFAIAYGVFQTSLFNNPGAFFDGIVGKNISYWWNQHKIERLTGPVTFHLRSMLLHELPVAALLAVAVFRVLWRMPHGKIALGVLGLAFSATIPFPWALNQNLPPALVSFFAAFKLKQSPDIFVYCLCFAFGILGTFQLLRENKFATAFLNYWTFASLAIYSYAGEKAPWLTVHIAFPAALLAGMYAGPRLTALVQSASEGWSLPKRQQLIAAALALLLCNQARLSYVVAYAKAGEPSDLLSQVHNHKDVDKVLSWIQREAFESGEKNEGISLALFGGVTWAFYFRLIEFKFKKFILEPKYLTGKERFILCDETNAKQLSDRLLKEGFEKRQYTHAGWWVPEHGKVTLGDWIQYALFRTPPFAPGTSQLYVFHKPWSAASPSAPPRDTAAAPAPVTLK